MDAAALISSLLYNFKNNCFTKYSYNYKSVRFISMTAAGKQRGRCEEMNFEERNLDVETDVFLCSDDLVTASHNYLEREIPLKFHATVFFSLIRGRFSNRKFVRYFLQAFFDFPRLCVYVIAWKCRRSN